MAAVASRTTNDSPHLGSKSSSPKDSKKSLPVQSEDSKGASKSDESKADGDSSNKASTNAEPLAPPPKPQPGDGDYFNTNHNNTNFNLEPNPFEQSFGNPSADTPGKNLLPSVASLTSPSSLLPGGTPNWTNSLRSGPLSPAMLAGPTGTNDYFGDSRFGGGFPTPNESSLRTGLTPGGGGSMFPAPSPNSQAFLNSLQSGGATPGTLDFHRAAASAKAASNNNYNNTNGQASQSESSMEGKQFSQQNQNQDQAQPDSYHDANDAANGLYMLAQANGARTNTRQFQASGQSGQSVNTNVANQVGAQSSETSPISKRGKNSIASTAGSGEPGDMSDEEQTKPATRSRGKKPTNTKAAAGNRRKAEEAPPKTPVSKKPKGISMEPEDEDSEDDEELNLKMGESGNKKMTDEEKRKNFLERNRVAALKCRQRKKQWLASLQAKVEYYTAENEALNTQLGQLREEVMNLKTILLAHKDCPITQQHGLNGMALANLLGDPSGQHAHPYGMGMQNGVPNSMAPSGFSMQHAPPAGMHRS